MTVHSPAISSKWDDDPRTQAARAVAIARELCTCNYPYHILWPLLRAAGIKGTLRPAEDQVLASFLVPLMADGTRILIAGSADTATLCTVGRMAGDRKPDFTVLDRCPAPLKLVQEFAAERQIACRTQLADLNSYAEDKPLGHRSGALHVSVHRAGRTVQRARAAVALPRAWRHPRLRGQGGPSNFGRRCARGGRGVVPKGLAKTSGGGSCVGPSGGPLRSASASSRGRPDASPSDYSVLEPSRRRYPPRGLGLDRGGPRREHLCARPCSGFQHHSCCIAP